MTADPAFHEEMIETLNYELKTIGPNCYIPIEEFPKRIDLEKLITNLIRTAIYEESQFKVNFPAKLFLLIQNETPNLTLLRELLPEMATIKCFDDIWELLQFLANETEEFFLVISSTSRLKIAPHMNISSRSHYRKFLQKAIHPDCEKFLRDNLKATEIALQKNHEDYSLTNNLVLQDVKSRFFTTDFLLRKNRYASKILKNIFSNQQKKDSRNDGSELPVGVGYFLLHSDKSFQTSKNPFLMATRIAIQESDIDRSFVEPIVKSIKKFVKKEPHQNLELWIESPIIEFNFLFFQALKEKLSSELMFESINTNFDQILTGWHPHLILASAIQRKKENQLICILLIHSERDADLFFLG